MSVRQSVVTVNIGRGYKTGEAHDNILRVRHGFPGAIIGWQEIDEADPADEHKILAATFGPAHYRNVGFAHAVPISVPLDWEIVPGSAKVTKASKWLAGASPDRFIVEVVATHPLLTEPVRFANGHYPLARLGGKEGGRRWEDCQAAWQSRAVEWHQSRITTVTTRDTNRLRRMPKVHPSERQLLPNAISRISVIPGSVDVKRIGTRVVNLTIDGHDAHAVDLVLSKAT